MKKLTSCEYSHANWINSMIKDKKTKFTLTPKIKTLVQKLDALNKEINTNAKNKNSNSDDV